MHFFKLLNGSAAARRDGSELARAREAAPEESTTGEAARPPTLTDYSIVQLSLLAAYGVWWSFAVVLPFIKSQCGRSANPSPTDRDFEIKHKIYRVQTAQKGHERILYRAHDSSQLWFLIASDADE